jgi:hypothetical protein
MQVDASPPALATGVPVRLLAAGQGRVLMTYLNSPASLASLSV